MNKNMDKWAKTWTNEQKNRTNEQKYGQMNRNQDKWTKNRTNEQAGAELCQAQGSDQPGTQLNLTFSNGLKWNLTIFILLIQLKVGADKKLHHFRSEKSFSSISNVATFSAVNSSGLSILLIKSRVFLLYSLEHSLLWCFWNEPVLSVSLVE